MNTLHPILKLKLFKNMRLLSFIIFVGLYECIISLYYTFLLES